MAYGRGVRGKTDGLADNDVVVLTSDPDDMVSVAAPKPITAIKI